MWKSIPQKGDFKKTLNSSSSRNPTSLSPVQCAWMKLKKNVISRDTLKLYTTNFNRTYSISWIDVTFMCKAVWTSSLWREILLHRCFWQTHRNYAFKGVANVELVILKLYLVTAWVIIFECVQCGSLFWVNMVKEFIFYKESDIHCNVSNKKFIFSI